MPRHVERGRLARREWFAEIDARHGLVEMRVHLHAFLGRTRGANQLIELFKHIAAFKSARAKARVLREDERVERVILERVLLGLQPDVRERIRRIVGVLQYEFSMERFRTGIQRRFKIVVGAILPVLRTGSAAARTKRIRRGQHKWCKN